MRALVFALILVASGLCSVGHVAHAQAGPSAQDRKAAEKFFNEATKHYNAGEYAQAIPGYISAYQLVPNSAILFTIGQAYRLSGERDKAITYYEKYVEFEPKGQAVEESKQHIAELQAAIAAEKAQADAAAAEKERARAQAEADARATAEKQRRADELARARVAAADEGHGLRVAGVTVGIIGVVGVGTGIGLAAADGKLSTGAIVVGAAGVACVATGGILYYLGVKRRNDAEAAVPRALVVPVIGPGTAGLAVVGSF